MTYTDLFGLLNALCSALLGSLAYSYAWWIHKEGNGMRRWMIWAGPIWGTVAMYHSAVWTADAFRPAINTVPWMRPFSWMLLALPAFTLFRAMIEDKRHVDARLADSVLVEAKRAEIEGTLNGHR